MNGLINGIVGGTINGRIDTLGSLLNYIKPTNLLITVLSDTSVKLDWTNTDTVIEGHVIERSSDGVTYSEVDTVTVGTNTFTDTLLTGSTIYYYRVAGYKGSRKSKYSGVNWGVTFPQGINTTNSAAWLRPRDVEAVEKVDGKDSIYWDMLYGKTARGAEQSSGTVYAFAVYEITACEPDFFYAGCAVGDVFICRANVTATATNKVKRVTGNHETQFDATKMPINGVFDGGNDFMSQRIFGMVQPEMVYLLFKIKTWEANSRIVNASTNGRGTLYMDGTATAPTVSATSAAGLFISDACDINKYVVVRMLLNGASSKLIVDNNTPVTGNCGTNGINGIVLGNDLTEATGAHYELVEAIYQKVIDTTEVETSIYTYLAAKRDELNGSKIVTLGDSVTRQKTWQPTMISGKTVTWSSLETDPGFDGVVAMGISSSKIVPLINESIEGQTIGNSIYERADSVDLLSPDIIILLGGYNDQIEDLGTVEDAVYTGDAVTENEPSFYAAYKGTLKKLTEQNTGKRIICATPAYNSAVSYVIQEAMAVAISDCAELYSCEFVDLLHNSGITAENYATYLSDGLHPNAAGGVLIGTYMATKI